MHVGRVLFRRAAISQIDTGVEWSARRSDAQPPWVPRLCKNRTVGMRETSGKLVPLSHRAPVSARDRTGSEKELSGFKVRMLRLFRTTVGLCWERGRRRGCARCGRRSSRPPSSPENGPKVTYQPSLMTLAGGARVCLAISRAKPWRGNARESDSLVRRRVLECLFAHWLICAFRTRRCCLSPQRIATRLELLVARGVLASHLLVSLNQAGQHATVVRLSESWETAPQT
ncbi:hypothetical protein BS50DRAFT_184126 [Corynespora cassiicola Philippines]|uniref:Uncharacterized protein n=1 Tax=Corynespora cassiicola Philippines TaxID=1448308 RepID=A0A2T2P7G1_CORCC|nr:hypothetical protein BS50DRAFT_184126 [Corynespora cassiicola Philippines]